MKLLLAELIKVYEIMKEKGVYLYGGGKEGLLALQTLEQEGINVHEVADQQVGKRVGNRCTVSIEKLCNNGGGGMHCDAFTSSSSNICKVRGTLWNCSG